MTTIVSSKVGGTNTTTFGLYTGLVGDGSNTVYTVTHNLNTSSQVVQVRRVSSGALVYPDISVVSNNAANLTFTITPTSNEYRVVVIGY